eukprot:scaffold215709_cov36-Tisochrysis_lutea.AAC.3
MSGGHCLPAVALSTDVEREGHHCERSRASSASGSIDAHPKTSSAGHVSDGEDNAEHLETSNFLRWGE